MITQGKWEAFKNQRTGLWSIKADKSIGPICLEQRGNEANARLIAAAPETEKQRDDLLKAIEKIKCFALGDDEGENIEAILNIIQNTV